MLRGMYFCDVILVKDMSSRKEPLGISYCIPIILSIVLETNVPESEHNQPVNGDAFDRKI
jgi:hypothetical protein